MPKMESLYEIYMATQLHEDPNINAFMHLDEGEFAMLWRAANEYRPLPETKMNFKHSFTICIGGVTYAGPASHGLPWEERRALAHKQHSNDEQLRRDIKFLKCFYEGSEDEIRHKVKFSRRKKCYEEWKMMNELGPKAAHFTGVACETDAE